MKIFVTGATGFIGSHFLNAALAAGHEVLALRRSAESQPRVPLDSQPAWLNKGMADVIPSDLAGCDVLVHLAAHSANVPYDTLENCLHWNVIVPLGLFRVAHSAGMRRYVVAGSCFEYGRAGERYEFIPTDAPLEPTQSYPASKAAASVAFYQLAVELKLELSIHRIFQVFGEGEPENRLWPSLKQAAEVGADFEMTGGEQIRDFVPVAAVASRLLATCGDKLPQGKPSFHNLGTGQAQTLKKFSEHWWREWGAKGQLIFGVNPYRVGEVMRFVPAL